MNNDFESRSRYRRNRNSQQPNGENPTPQPPYHNEDRVYRIIRRVIVLFFILIALLGGYEYYQLHQTASSVFSNSSKVSKKLREGQPISILAMGTDEGALGRSESTWGDGNTDSIELITVNPKKKTITMTSIPRDTLVKVTTSDGDTEYVKINAAYSIGGAKQSVKQVKELLGVPVDYYALVNMSVLQKIVDAVGGVDVNNPFKFTYEGHTFKKGKQHLNGTNALKYSRMRYDDPNNDYGRQKRQQQVIGSIIKSFKKNASLSAFNKMLDAVESGVKTNIPLSGVSTIYANYKVSMNNVKTYHFQGKDATIDGTSYQLASPKEINRVSKLVRHALELKVKTVTNNETKLYNYNVKYTSYDGYNNTEFTIPSSSSSSSYDSSYGSSYGTSSYGGGSTYGTSTGYGY